MSTNKRDTHKHERSITNVNNVVFFLFLLVLILTLTSCSFFPHYEIDTSHFSENYIDAVLRNSAVSKSGRVVIDQKKIQIEILNYLNKNYFFNTDLEDLKTYLTSINANCKENTTSHMECIYFQYWNTPIKKGWFSNEIVVNGNHQACIEIHSKMESKNELSHSVIVDTYPMHMNEICRRKAKTVGDK